MRQVIQVSQLESPFTGVIACLFCFLLLFGDLGVTAQVTVYGILSVSLVRYL